MYSLSEIKDAFYEVFYQAGDLFFPYIEMGASEKECKESVKDYWEEFEESLEKPIIRIK
jgi:hypothetical protein